MLECVCIYIYIYDICVCTRSLAYLKHTAVWRCDSQPHEQIACFKGIRWDTREVAPLTILVGALAVHVRFGL